MFYLYTFLKDFIYLFIDTEREREREAETQAEGEAGSTQGARRGTRSRVSTITPRAAGSAKPLRYGGRPEDNFQCRQSCHLQEKSLVSTFSTLIIIFLILFH